MLKCKIGGKAHLSVKAWCGDPPTVPVNSHDPAVGQTGERLPCVCAFSIVQRLCLLSRMEAILSHITDNVSVVGADKDPFSLTVIGGQREKVGAFVFTRNGDLLNLIPVSKIL